VPPGGVPSNALISAGTDREVLDLYAEVMGEMMMRSREAHRDHWGPEDESPGPLVAVDDEGLRRLYRAVHDEMLSRQEERPGVWEPRDSADGDGAQV
jgi:hypothetical protein